MAKGKTLPESLFHLEHEQVGHGRPSACILEALEAFGVKPKHIGSFRLQLDREHEYLAIGLKAGFANNLWK